MRRIFSNLKRNYFYLCFSLATLVGGAYTWLHHGYLDDPRITPPPPLPVIEHRTVNFVDDRWFATILLIVGIVLLIGVLGDVQPMLDIGIVACAPIFAAIFFAFGWRGNFDFRFNHTWWVSGLVLLLLFERIGRGRHGNG